MKKFLFSIIILLSTQLRAEPRSFVCPENNHLYKGVTCCLDAVTKVACEKIVDHQLPAQVQKAIKTVQKQFSEGHYVFGQVPNCFWSAGIYANLVEFKETPSFLNAHDLLDVLVSHTEVNAPFVQGDVLLFEAIGEIREDVVENNIPKRIWIPYTSVEHAAIALGDGLLFQKENIGSDVFSIDSIENTRVKYQSGWNLSPQFRGEFQPIGLRQ